MLNPVELASFLSSKLCHDLISPVSALNTAIDVLEDPKASEIHAEALELIKSSSRQTSAKLKFSRLAFGSGVMGYVETSEIQELVEGALKTQRLSFQWGHFKEHYEKKIARVILNQCLVACATLPRGGVVTLLDTSVTRSDIVMMSVCEGQKARFEETIQKVLDTDQAEASDIHTRTILPYFLRVLVNSLQGNITLFDTPENQIKFSVRIPV